jgi:hypothetical protein
MRRPITPHKRKTLMELGIIVFVMLALLALILGVHGRVSDRRSAAPMNSNASVAPLVEMHEKATGRTK